MLVTLFFSNPFPCARQRFDEEEKKVVTTKKKVACKVQNKFPPPPLPPIILVVYSNFYNFWLTLRNYHNGKKEVSEQIPLNPKTPLSPFPPFNNLTTYIKKKNGKKN